MDETKCVYYCLYGDARYIEILEVSVKSLNKFISKNNIFVYSEFDVPELGLYCNLIKTKFPEGFSIPMAYRLILGKNLLVNYDKVLHLDADTIICDNIDVIFNSFKQNEISFASENLNNPNKITEHYWAGPLLNSDEIKLYNNTNSICCGVFGFNKSMQLILEKIYNFIVECENSGFKGICRDQHAFTTYVLRNNLYNYNLQKYVCHTPYLKNNYSDYKVYHFAGGVNSGNKYNDMKLFLDENY